MANKLKEMRFKRMMTMAELSRRSGISRTTIWNIETKPDWDVNSGTMIALAKALDMTVNDIFFADGV